MKFRGVLGSVLGSVLGGLLGYTVKALFGWCIQAGLVLVRGLGNLPMVQVQTAETVWYSSRPVQEPNLLPISGANPYMHPSTGRFGRMWLDPSGPIPSSAFRVVIFMVAFKYPTVDHTILTVVCHHVCWMYWPPL